MLTFSALELIDHQENAEGTPIRDLATRFSQRARKHEPGTLRDPWLGVVVHGPVCPARRSVFLHSSEYSLSSHLHVFAVPNVPSAS